MIIDPHVHLRDFNEAHKETIAHGLKVAELAGLTAVCDMPNSNPPASSLEVVLQRIERAKAAESPVKYFIYMLLTPDEAQVRKAVEAYNQVPQVVGFKIYVGPTTGSPGIKEEKYVRAIYRTLGAEGFKGPVGVHCEQESMFDEGFWSKDNPRPSKPRFHAYSRPWQSEVVSVAEQLRFAKEEGFQGTLYVPHVSVPESVYLVNEVRGVNAVCGVCPHHLLFDWGVMTEPDGLLMKMNPPLRPPGMNDELLKLLLEGKIDWIETDHAPHLESEHREPPYASGVIGLPKWPKFVKWLRDKGMRDGQIRDVTFNNVRRAFPKLRDLVPRECTPVEGLDGRYPYDQYKPFGVLK